MKINEHDAGQHDEDGCQAHIWYFKYRLPPEISGPISTKLGMYHGGLQHIMVCSNDDPGLTLDLFLRQGQNLVTWGFSIGKKLKTVNFSKNH